MKKGLVTLAAIIGILAVCFLLRYGTLSPCEAVKKQLKSCLLSSALTDTPSGLGETIGQTLGLVLAGPMIDYMADTLTPIQCLRALCLLEIEGENAFMVQLYRSNMWHTDVSTESSTVSPKKPEWVIHTEISLVDGSEDISLWIEAEKLVPGCSENDEPPVLIMQCKENMTNAGIIFIEMTPKTECGSDGQEYAYLTLRFDKENAFQEKFIVPPNSNVALFPGHILYIKRMLEHKRLFVKFTPLNAPQQSATFNLEGLSDKIGPLRETCQAACHW